MKRNSMGWALGATPLRLARRASASSLDFGNPRAAAAHDKRVVNDALNAASLSSRTDGDMKGGPPRWTRVCDLWENEGLVNPL